MAPIGEFTCAEFAGEDRASDAELRRDPLVHGVDVAADDVEVLAGRQEALQLGLQELRPAQFLFGLVLPGREMYAPAVGRPLPMEQVRPLVGIGNVVALGVAVLAEIVGDLDVERAVGIGEALELDAEVLADDAARAFAADDDSGRGFFPSRRSGW